MIKLITDSASDIPRDEQVEHDIEVLPIPINVDGRTYYEGIDFTSQEYYDILVNAKEQPTHSQITMIQYGEAFFNAAKDGYQHIVCVTITSKGSGIYDAACSAKKMLLLDKPDVMKDVTIDIIDSTTYTYAYGHMVVAAAKLAKETNDIQQVLSLITEYKDTYTAMVGLTNLTYAKRSGRITSAAAFVGEVMGFRPILEMVDGTLLTCKKVRGDHKLIEELASRYFELSAEDGRPYYIICADSMANAELLKKALKKSKNKFGGFYSIGASVTTNAGPTVFGMVLPK